jgi:chemotaxis protein histidine kinase CheA/CheY-like chemotaxis protein
MLPEQQQRILGYFIEEAKDHLNTIEQGLLNLQSTLNDPELINEVFRAAHSIKGGAAMLGLSSIQHTAHRLEDCFKILKEHPIKVDQKLESLFLGVSDTLKALLEHLTGPFGLSEEIANDLMSETEPVFKWLLEHLDELVRQGNSEVANYTFNSSAISTQIQPIPLESFQGQQVQTQVIRTLREMLHLFKQTATPETRQNLQECCLDLVTLGEESNWSRWCNLCQSAGSAVVNPENTYLVLAKVLITEIKQALELVLAGREAEISLSPQLKSLVGSQEIELLEIPVDIFDEPSAIEAQPLEFSEPTVSTATANLTSSTEAFLLTTDTNDDISLESEPEDSISTLTELTDQLPIEIDNDSLIVSIDEINDSKGPEVGTAELTELDKLFQGETSELGDLVIQEKTSDIGAIHQLEVDETNTSSQDTESEFKEFFSPEVASSDTQLTKPTQEELTILQLFGENFLEQEIAELQNHQNVDFNIDFNDTSNSESAEKITLLQTPINSEESTDIVEKIEDEISDLLSLKIDGIDENEALSIEEVTQKEVDIIPEIQFSVNSKDIFDNFLETTQTSRNQAESRTTLSPKENSSLEDLFSVSEDIKPPQDKSISSDLFDLLSSQNETIPHQTKTSFSSENNLSLDELFSEVEDYTTISHHSQGTYNDLDDIFGNIEAPEASSAANLNQKELAVNFQTEQQELDLNFSSDAGDDVFEELASTTSTISFSVESDEVSPEEIRSYAPQQPEALTLTPEFTDTPTGTSQNHFREPQTLSTDSQADELTSTASTVAEEETVASPIAQVENTEVQLIEQDDIALMEEFAELDELLQQEQLEPLPNSFSIPEHEITSLEALLDSVSTEVENDTESLQTNPVLPEEIEDGFRELEQMLVGQGKVSLPPQPSSLRSPKFEQLMKVPVKHLDDLSNLVGELVVNRNTLEQDQERLRQSLDNLLSQVQQLNDVGARMQELYERSLLEASLLASRRNNGFGSNHDTDRGFSELEMDRFTPFHTLSQEMIELIVRVRESASDIDFVTDETERVARQFRQVTTQLQEGITRSRMEPFADVTTPLERGVRESAIKYGKQAQLTIEGKDTLIDKMILEHLKTPLTHLLNNAIAHGIEPAEVRQTAQKPLVGAITVRAYHQGNQTVISVSDDGAGIDPEKVTAKAVKMGIATPQQAKALSHGDIYDLLFQPGFSTKDKEDELAGRGVGLDVVRTRISEIRGTITVDSTLGKGTTFTIRLPLTLSICKALCCISDKARIAFPMDGVEDTLDVPLKNIQQGTNGEKLVPWRETLLPFRPLKEILTYNRHLSRGNVYGGNRDDDMISIIVVRSANTLVALQVDQVLNEQEIVIKQFEGPAPKPIGVAGATVLGDGRIMPIVDVLEIVDIFQGRTSNQRSVSLWEQKATSASDTIDEKIDPTVLIVDDSITVRELLSLTFNKAGYRVEQARDGQEAWDKLRSGLPCDIVFCDIEMPRCDGLELLSRIQQDPNLNHLPIAMLTSRGADKHRQMAIQLGASGYFTKPYLEEALLEAASRMLKGENLIN